MFRRSHLKIFSNMSVARRHNDRVGSRGSVAWLPSHARTSPVSCQSRPNLTSASAGPLHTVRGHRGAQTSRWANSSHRRPQAALLLMPHILPCRIKKAIANACRAAATVDANLKLRRDRTFDFAKDAAGGHFALNVPCAVLAPRRACAWVSHRH